MSAPNLNIQGLRDQNGKNEGCLGGGCAGREGWLMKPLQCLSFLPKYNWEKEEERQRVCVCVCVCVWSVLLVCSLFWKSTFGEVEWLEWRCFPCAHSAFFIKHSCRGNQMLQRLSLLKKWSIFSWIKSRSLETDLFKDVPQNMGRNWAALFIVWLLFCLCHKVKMFFVSGKWTNGENVFILKMQSLR